MSWWELAQDGERWRIAVDEVLARVIHARDSGRLPQAILLAGQPGLGREVAAVEAAVLLTCSDAPVPWVRSSCADRVRRGIHPDVLAVLPQPPSDLIKIDQVREVVEAVSGRPFEGLRRVWIFDGVEAGRFGAQAANAFLKTLEEPPEHARFLLLAANPAAVLPTIRSRCQVLALPGPMALAGRLGFELPPELAAAALAGGDVSEAVRGIRGDLPAALAGDLDALLRLTRIAESGAGSSLETVAAMAVAMAGDRERAGVASDLVRLAADLLATDRRARALNLDSERQQASCLLRWYRELDASAARSPRSS